ncbi:sel1 repeat family protein [Dichotomicrobium thermohalophilum]|uniref:sel1 repeat family protein n=1 Tax=Dichotomicrobium thermohalophilum TaxID=933063 RepID=UPI000E5A4467|nr:sel1 repeat family protein [Dichotomicrobium thermohalophilum]
MLGLLTMEGAALAETPGQVERAARLVEGEEVGVQGQRIAQNVSSGFAVAEISGPPKTPIPIRVQLPEINDGVYNFLVFQNLPGEFDMSAGFPVDDRWVVPLDEVSDLTVTAPQGYNGSFDLRVKLRIGGTEKSETRTVTVNISEPGAGERTAKANEATGSTGALSPETEAAMIQRAESMLQTRDVSGARNIYLFLVRKGSGKAAFGLARTYDPAYVEEIGVAGMDAADLEKAKKWYERAALLGHKEAQERLKVLAAGG